MSEELSEERKEELNKRLGWILCELGKEDAEVARLKQSLRMHIGRRNAMEIACDRICKELGMDVPDKSSPQRNMSTEDRKRMHEMAERSDI